MLPNFLCIGAQKSGTTTLLNQLDRHPDIFMSPARETKFFLLDHLYSQGVTAYEKDFFSDWNGQKAVGEKTPEYLCDPLIPQRIDATLGKSIKFIVTFRSPAQRAYSHYRHNFQQLWENLSFPEAIAQEQNRSSAGRYQRLRYGYLDRGHYGRQLARYLELFPKDGFMFLVYEKDIVMRQADTLRRVFEFLGVAPSYIPPDIVSAGRALPMFPRLLEQDERIESEGMKLEGKAGDILLTRQGMKPRLIRSPSRTLVAYAKAVSANIPQEQALSREEELALNRRYFTNDIRVLEDIIGTDLGSWLG